MVLPCLFCEMLNRFMISFDVRLIAFNYFFLFYFVLFSCLSRRTQRSQNELHYNYITDCEISIRMCPLVIFFFAMSFVPKCFYIFKTKLFRHFYQELINLRRFFCVYTALLLNYVLTMNHLPIFIHLFFVFLFRPQTIYVILTIEQLESKTASENGAIFFWYVYAIIFMVWHNMLAFVYMCAHTFPSHVLWERIFISFFILLFLSIPFPSPRWNKSPEYMHEADPVQLCKSHSYWNGVFHVFVGRSAYIFCGRQKLHEFAYLMLSWLVHYFQNSLVSYVFFYFGIITYIMIPTLLIYYYSCKILFLIIAI